MAKSVVGPCIPSCCGNRCSFVKIPGIPPCCCCCCCGAGCRDENPRDSATSFLRWWKSNKRTSSATMTTTVATTRATTMGNVSSGAKDEEEEEEDEEWRGTIEPGKSFFEDLLKERSEKKSAKEEKKKKKGERKEGLWKMSRLSFLWSAVFAFAFIFHRVFLARGNCRSFFLLFFWIPFFHQIFSFLFSSSLLFRCDYASLSEFVYLRPPVGPYVRFLRVKRHQMTSSPMI